MARCLLLDQGPCMFLCLVDGQAYHESRQMLRTLSCDYSNSAIREEQTAQSSKARLRDDSFSEETCCSVLVTATNLDFQAAATAATGTMTCLCDRKV